MTKEEQGAEKWAELHRYALSIKNLADAPKWIENWLSALSCGPCKTGGIAYVQKNLPDISSRSGLFDWSVKFHNAISAQPDLSKPQWTVDEAYARWSQPEKIMEMIKPSSPTFSPDDVERVLFSISGGDWLESTGATGKFVDNLSISTRRAMSKADGSNPREVRPSVGTKLVSPPPVLSATASEADKAKAAAIAACADEIRVAVKKLLPFIGE